MMDKLENLIRKILQCFRINLSERTLQALIQFIKFGIVGVTNTFIGYGLNILVLLILDPFHVSWDWVAGNAISFILSVLWSFYWNNKYVFTMKEGQHRDLGKALLKTYISYAFTGIFLNMILSYIWIEILGISKYIAPMINLIISVPVNFLINKFWAFRTKDEPSEIQNTAEN